MQLTRAMHWSKQIKRQLPPRVIEMFSHESKAQRENMAR